MEFDWTYSGIDDAAEVCCALYPGHGTAQSYANWIRNHTESTINAPGYWDCGGVVVTTYAADHLPPNTLGCVVALSPWGVREYLKKQSTLNSVNAECDKSITDECYRRSLRLAQAERTAWKHFEENKKDASAYVAWNDARMAEQRFNESVGIIEEDYV